MADALQGRVFISYSRADQAAAERVRDALIKRNFEAYLDTHDIAPAEDWRSRLGALIASAEKVVFLISPDSAASAICDWEVNRAERLGKSIVPVVIRETDPLAVPERLSRLNFIFLRSEAERGAAHERILQALTVDLEWEREKTEIGKLAERWDQVGRSSSLLLANEDAIRSAELWRDSWPKTSPPPTDEMRAFIAASRARFGNRQRRLLSAAGVALALLAGLSVAALLLREQALENEARAEENAQEARRNSEEAEKNATRAAAERDQALKTQSRFLADLSRQERERGDVVNGVLLALAALPDGALDPIGAGVNARPYVSMAELSLNRALLEQRERLILDAYALAGYAGAASFSPDGAKIVTSASRHTARLWDVESGADIATLAGHSDDVVSAVFAPDGARVVTASHRQHGTNLERLDRRRDRCSRRPC